jgi:AraC-like DNA-binding protein
VIAGLTIGGFMLRKNRKQKKAANKYKTVSIDRVRAEKAVADIQRLMNEQKLYLNPDLTLKDLARKLNLHNNYLSRVLNEYFRQSYSDFINEFRISEAMKMLGNPDHRDRTILEIMYETGFYSKSVFNTAFKKLTGKTPSAYRRQKLG